jgi:hypothetical protein
MLCREVSDEIAMAIEARRLASERDWDASPMAPFSQAAAVGPCRGRWLPWAA